jgi:adenosyl cobinamide kinase/adenosyl cobinamide phosphate guanylyltransferase
VERARKIGDRVVFVATCDPQDEEMERRVAEHRKGRPTTWTTIEEPRNVARSIGKATDCDCIILDCLTLLVTNWLMDRLEGGTILDRAQELMAACQSAACPVIVVSNEVGLGIVPESALGRQFRDLASTVNQIAARVADEAYFVVSGIPVKLK